MTVIGAKAVEEAVTAAVAGKEAESVAGKVTTMGAAAEKTKGVVGAEIVKIGVVEAGIEMKGAAEAETEKTGAVESGTGIENVAKTAGTNARVKGIDGGENAA